MPFHRFSPFSTKAIKKMPKKTKKIKNKHLSNDDLVLTLLTLGYTFEQSIACLSYLEHNTVIEAIEIIELFN